MATTRRVTESNTPAKRWYATGRRKEATARVYLASGSGRILINGREITEYLRRPALEMLVGQPFEIIERKDQFDVLATVRGGGLAGQAGAIRHGIARALLDLDADANRVPLRQAGLLTRDPRMKERKKYGLKRARKAPQYTKR